ncbi:Multi antimicrobial extrusion protein [Corchorus capsularis]|uniref:Protein DETOXIFICATION n=1 Tax=Corchorus capsularis TaxID=210143 RepID=A0A1R3GBZ6_COCAP|nr:Multi antimicrobial extrusion protein [Corchorus capsularis]
MDEALLPKKEGRIWKIITWEALVEELKKVSLVAAPFVAVAFSQYLLQVVSMMMAGHLGELALSGAAIATSFCNVTGFSLLWGFSAALETLNGQAYGAMQYEKLGSYTYCAFISTLPICLPVCILWMYMDKLLVLMGQDPQVAVVACRYSMWLIPGLFAYCILQTQIRFLQSQSLMLPLLFTSLATLCFHIPVCWVLEFRTGLGNIGAALAISISYWFNVILLGLYMRYSSSCEKTRVLCLKDVFLSVKEFFQFAIPSAVMACLEWWSYEILVLMSGLLPNSTLETSVLSICLTSAALHYQLPFGISVAASTRISNELGAGNPQAAQLSAIIVVALTLIETVIASTTLFCCRHVFGYAYSNELDVVNKVTDMIPLMCLSFIMDGLHGVACGIVRGIGWQHIGAYANLAAYYLFGIPAGIICAFVLHLRGEGLWIGMVTGSSAQGILLVLVIAFTNWKKQAIEARERIFQGAIPESGLF